MARDRLGKMPLRGAASPDTVFRGRERKAANGFAIDNQAPLLNSASRHGC